MLFAVVMDIIGVDVKAGVGVGVGVSAVWFALKTTLFGKYKKFELIPKIEKVSLKHIGHYFLMLVVVTVFFIASTYVVCDIIGQALSIALCGMVGFVAQVIFGIFWIKWYIERYSTIQEKIETEIVHD
jgi:hypothetical protein